MAPSIEKYDYILNMKTVAKIKKTQGDSTVQEKNIFIGLDYELESNIVKAGLANKINSIKQQWYIQKNNDLKRRYQYFERVEPQDYKKAVQKIIPHAGSQYIILKPILYSKKERLIGNGGMAVFFLFLLFLVLHLIKMLSRVEQSSKEK